MGTPAGLRIGELACKRAAVETLHLFCDSTHLDEEVIRCGTPEAGVLLWHHVYQLPTIAETAPSGRQRAGAFAIERSSRASCGMVGFATSGATLRQIGQEPENWLVSQGTNAPPVLLTPGAVPPVFRTGRATTLGTGRAWRTCSHGS